jgi:hypothetical protein
MAMEIYVLSDRRLNSWTEWQRAIDMESFPFPLQLSAIASFDDLDGFLPVRYENAQTGSECDHWASRSIVVDYPHNGFGRSWKYALAFRFGVRPGELESAWMAATAYARATNGVVFDTEEGKLLHPDEAAQIVRKIENNRPLRAVIHEAIKQKFFPDL